MATEEQNIIVSDNQTAWEEIIILPAEESPPPAKKKLNKARILKVVSIFVMVAVLGITAYYILFPQRGFFHSDCADTILWAEASYDAGAVFNEDFGYACKLPFGGHLIMIPLVAIFGVSMTAHVLGMLIFFALFVLALVFMLRQIRWSTPWTCMTVSALVLTLSVSEKLREIFWGHIIYYSLGIFLLFVGMGLLVKTIKAAETASLKSRGFLVPFCLLFVWVTLGATNHIEALTLFILPVLAGFFGERFFDFGAKLQKRELRNFSVILGAVIVGTGLGFAIGLVLKQGVAAGYQAAYSDFSNPADWLNNALNFPAHWFTLLGVTAVGDDPLFDAKGMINIVRILFGATLVVAPVIVTLLYPKLRDRFSKMLILAHWAITALILIAYIFGSLSTANWRLSPIVCTAVLLTMILGRHIYQKTNKKRLLLLLFVPMLITGLVTAGQIVTMPPSYGQDTGAYALADYLERQGLSYGYGTFWNSHVLTVVSDSEVKVRTVSVDEGLLQKTGYQTNRNWYHAIPGQDRYFLLLSAEEYERVKTAGFSGIEDSVQTLQFDSYYILVFERNLFE
ncbi:MAG: hypothetical protein LBS36_09645 [Oscillospiraceae bacterium]|jgi:hypothetical protein|nr:hypothetical protein [Oscillospiraceae bacterium]